MASFHIRFSTGSGSPLNTDGLFPMTAFHCPWVTSVLPQPIGPGQRHRMRRRRVPSRPSQKSPAPASPAQSQAPAPPSLPGRLHPPPNEINAQPAVKTNIRTRRHIAFGACARLDLERKPVPVAASPAFPPKGIIRAQSSPSTSPFSLAQSFLRRFLLGSVRIKPDLLLRRKEGMIGQKTDRDGILSPDYAFLWETSWAGCHGTGLRSKSSLARSQAMCVEPSCWGNEIRFSERRRWIYRIPPDPPAARRPSRRTWWSSMTISARADDITWRRQPRIREVVVVEADRQGSARLTTAMAGSDAVIHLAANPDVSRRPSPSPISTFGKALYLAQNVLGAIRVNAVPRLLYMSGSGVYGEKPPRRLSRGLRPPACRSRPMAPASSPCEALICSYCHLFGLIARAFRFANVVGPRQTHGVGYDFIRRLRADPTQLRILGSGSQSKSYIHVEDIMEAVFLADRGTTGRYDVFNVATGDYITVAQIAELAVQVVPGWVPVRSATTSREGTADGRETCPSFVLIARRSNRSAGPANARPPKPWSRPWPQCGKNWTMPDRPAPNAVEHRLPPGVEPAPVDLEHRRPRPERGHHGWGIRRLVP